MEQYSSRAARQVLSSMQQLQNKCTDVLQAFRFSGQEIAELGTSISEKENGAAIKLSADDKNSDSSALVLEISRYRRLAMPADTLEKAQKKYEEQIRVETGNLSAAVDGFSLFQSAEKKEKAETAYRFLVELLQGEYGQQIDFAYKQLEISHGITAEDAWEEFAQDPVPFYHVLEKLLPDLFDKGISDQGLQADTAKEIETLQFSLQGLKGTLRSYQEWGVKYILHQKRVLLGDEMGLGKTFEAIASMVALRNAGGSHFLVVCPASVLLNWIREIAKFSDLRVQEIHGSDRQDEIDQWLERGGVAVTTYETTGAIELAEEFKFTQLVVDEAHYIKNTNAKRTENVKRIAEHAHRILFMTGTAMENNVEEMVNLVSILDKDVARSLRGLKNARLADKFREKLAPVYCRRRREDVLTELPELTMTQQWCKLGKEEKKVYRSAVLRQKYAEARRVSFNVEDLSLSSKAQRMLELMAEAESEGRKIIVFSFFLDTMEKITELLGDKCYGPINGSVSPAKRQAIIDEFDKAPAGSVLAAQIQAGGTGLNIQSASVVILCEPQFKPSIEHQAISRAYRMGQTRNVLVYRLLCENTVDEKITAILSQKQADFEAFADVGNATEDNFALSDTTFTRIMEEEADRIRQEEGSTTLDS